MERWSLKTFGISHKRAPVALRELFAFSDLETTQLLMQLREVLAVEEAMVLSTCNRTEVYYVSERPLGKEIATLLGVPAASYALFYEKNIAKEAIAHLFSVALGIESQILGDQQVLNQAKQAYQHAVHAQLSGPCLHRLMHSIFYSHKRITKETSWCDGVTSIPYAAVELLRASLQGHSQQEVLVLGLGEVGTDVCRNLQYLKEATTVYVANRTYHKAIAIAEKYGFTAIPFNQYSNYIKKVDVLITCLHKKTPLITHDMLQHRKKRMYLLDMSVPRSVSSDVEQLAGVILHNIDNIKEITSKTTTAREAARPAVKKIAEEVQTDFMSWCQEKTFSPIIQRFKQVLEHMRKEEMKRAIKDLTSEEGKKVDAITRALIQRIIKYPVLQLKSACKRGEAGAMADLLADLFDLEKTDMPHTENDFKHTK